MILCDEAEARLYEDGGAWGGASIDALFRHTAESHPERIALTGDWSDAGTGETSITYGQAESSIGRTAAGLQLLDLKPDAVIGVQISQTIDCVLFCLACWRAGLIVAPLPAVWRAGEITPALEGQSTRALAAMSADMSKAEDLRDVAVNLFNIRYVFGSGDNLPEGVIDLGTMVGDDNLEPLVRVPRADNAANHVATITWTTHEDQENFGIFRTHNQWLAAGRSTYVETDIENGASIVCAYGMSGMAGFAGALIPWILSGGTLHLHAFQTVGRLADHINAVGPDLVPVPLSLVDPLAAALDSAGGPTLLAVRSIRELEADSQQQSDGTPLELVLIDEFAAIVRRRDPHNSSHLIPLLPITIGDDAGAVLLDLSVKVPDDQSSKLQSGELRVRGAMTPCATAAVGRQPAAKVTLKRDRQGYIRTGFGFKLESRARDLARPLGRLADVIVVGGLPIPLKSLDDLFKNYPDAKDAAAFAVPDRVLGSRLYAAIVPKQLPFDEQAFRAYLADSQTGMHKFPGAVVSVASIPRSANGAVHRSKLLETLTGTR